MPLQAHLWPGINQVPRQRHQRQTAHRLRRRWLKHFIYFDAKLKKYTQDTKMAAHMHTHTYVHLHLPPCPVSHFINFKMAHTQFKKVDATLFIYFINLININAHVNCIPTTECIGVCVCVWVPHLFIWQPIWAKRKVATKTSLCLKSLNTS